MVVVEMLMFMGGMAMFIGVTGIGVTGEEWRRSRPPWPELAGDGGGMFTCANLSC